MKNSKTDRLVLVILQAIVGAIVILGGAALVYFSVDTTGKALGVVHAILGLTVIPTTFLLWTRKSGALTLALAVNALVIAFSTASEGILYATSSLPSGAFEDSMVGTLLAVLIAAVVILQLTRKNLRRKFEVRIRAGPTNRSI